MIRVRKNGSLIKLIIVIVLFGFIICYLRDHFLTRDAVLEIKGANKIYLALNETKKLELDLVLSKYGSSKLNYKSNDDDIVFVDNEGFLTAKTIGNTSIVVSSIKKNKIIEVFVTDLITIPTYSQDKAELSCKKYSEEENKLLDDILKTDIENAGYQSRAGVVAAARFLALRFPYKINYFYENGRLTSETRKYIDGEGRYYHIGLYLSEKKFDTLISNASSLEPVIWGCDLYANYVKTYSRNGLNCSGFISWAMLNGGFDVGDIGAGITSEYDFTDMGEKTDISLELLNSGNVKVGDLIGRNGHIAIIIGIAKDKIYIAESYMPSMKVREFTYEELVNNEDFKYIMLMDSVYKIDGNITNMW